MVQQTTCYFILAFNNLLRLCYVILGLLIIITFIIAISWLYIAPTEATQLNSRITQIENSKIYTLIPNKNHSYYKDASNIKSNILKNQLCKKIKGDKNQHKYIVFSSNVISNALTQHSANMSNMIILTITNPLPHNLRLEQIIPLLLFNNSNFYYIIWKTSSYITNDYNQTSDIFKNSVINTLGVWCTDIQISNLNYIFNAITYNVVLNSSDINISNKILQSKLNFYKLYDGNLFPALTSKKILNSINTPNQPLYIRLCTGSRDNYKLHFKDKKSYKRNVISLTSSFMRFPTIKQFRVSSNFNLRRLNPVTGRITPHCGVDFAVPIGTPVLAVGDGEVVISKNGGAAGNYITIRHNHQYMTRYMHLKKLFVKPGQKVKRGYCIALSGNTGRSTGPHLHFEVWINQQAVNPLTAKLPRTKWLKRKDCLDYLAFKRPYYSL